MILIRALLKFPMYLWLLMAVGLGGYKYYDWNENTYKPLLTQIEDRKADLEHQKKALAKAEDFRRRRDEKLKELQELGLKLEATRKEMPRTASIPDLLKSLADASDQTGLEFSRFHPENERRNAFLVETPITVALKGTYVQVMSFLDAAANLTRVVATERMELAAETRRTGLSFLTANASLLTYHLDDAAFDAEPAPPAPAVGGKVGK